MFEIISENIKKKNKKNNIYIFCLSISRYINYIIN
jgi:hypothetical protein